MTWCILGKAAIKHRGLSQINHNVTLTTIFDMWDRKLSTQFSSKVLRIQVMANGDVECI